MSLNEFLLKKAGKTWDDVAESAAKMKGINPETVNYFKKRAVKSGRMSDDETDGGIIVSLFKGKYKKELLDLYNLTCLLKQAK